MFETSKKLTELLLKFFPASERLSYDDYITDDMVRNLYGDRVIIEKYFQMISVPWTEISWKEVENTRLTDFSSGLMVLPLLSPKGFAHVFPSLLAETVKDNKIYLFYEYFVAEHLNLHNVIKDWEKDFYFSLPDDVKKIIGFILRTGGSDETLESYWHSFRDTAVSQAMAASNDSLHGRIKSDLNLGGINMTFRRIEAGRFMMGSKVDKRYYDMYGENMDIKYYDPFALEKVRHLVYITRPFYMGQYPVTQAQWLKVMDDNPSYFVRNDEHPVESISWDDAQTFIAKLNAEIKKNESGAHCQIRQFITQLNEEAGLDEETGYIFRLPTEAEWEYACRAVSETDPEREIKENWRWFFGDDPVELEHYAWFEQNAGLTTHPVGQKRPNPWGLYDLYGNVWEWVWDYFGEYPDREVTDPTEPLNRLVPRVRRGGSFSFPIRDVRSAQRSMGFPHGRSGFAGFRLVLAPRLE
jgi:formylglycine-generating enzyme required for sulfatase activity